MIAAVAPTLLPPSHPPIPPADSSIDLHTLTGEVVREMIRRDPALWACLQDDPELRRAFGFEPDSPVQ